MKSPVLLVGFNRPDYLQKVFNQIKRYKPDRFYVAIDGPREYVQGEREKCRECQQIINQIDWDCDLNTMFREKNVGCGFGVSGAASWAFEKEDSLIILEDDCVPVDSFFKFCEMMLEKYENDTRVWQVAGRSYHPNSKFFEHSDYIFSHYPHVWGWATWKRCWEQFDFNMKDLPEYLSLGGSLNTSGSKKLGVRENRKFKMVYDDIKSIELYQTWDYQWGYLLAKNNGLSIVPKKNLVHNIGAVGTHASKNQKPDIPSEEMSLDIRHPHFVIPSREYDLYHGKKVVYPTPNYLRKIAGKLYHLFFK